MSQKYYLTLKGAERVSLPLGTPFVKTGSPDPYRVLSAGEHFYRIDSELKFDNQTEYGFNMTDVTLTNPYSRSNTGPWTILPSVITGMDRLPSASVDAYDFTNGFQCEDLGIEFFSSLRVSTALPSGERINYNISLTTYESGMALLAVCVHDLDVVTVEAARNIAKDANILINANPLVSMLSTRIAQTSIDFNAVGLDLVLKL